MEEQDDEEKRTKDQVIAFLGSEAVRQVTSRAKQILAQLGNIESEQREGPAFPRCPGCRANLSESLSSMVKPLGMGHDISDQGDFGIIEIFFCSECNHTLSIRRIYPEAMIPVG